MHPGNSQKEDRAVELVLVSLFVIAVGIVIGVVANLFRRWRGKGRGAKGSGPNVGAEAGYYGPFGDGGNDGGGGGNSR